MSDAPILVAIDNHIATVTLNRPEKGNALTSVMWGELSACIGKLPDNVRVVVLKGAGDRVFCAGADMSEFVAGDYDASTNYGAMFDSALASIAHHPCPVIAMIYGQALGGGCQLALACDFRIAADTAQLGIPAARLGLVIPPGAHERLIQIVGLQKAREIMYLGRRYDAQHALEMGLIDWVTSRESLEAEANALAAEIAGNAPLAVRGAKQALNATLDRYAWDPERDAHALRELQRAAQRAFESQDAAEGLSAFFQKRKPEFTGQ